MGAENTELSGEFTNPMMTSRTEVSEQAEEKQSPTLVLQDIVDEESINEQFSANNRVTIAYERVTESS